MIMYHLNIMYPDMIVQFINNQVHFFYYFYYWPLNIHSFQILNCEQTCSPATSNGSSTIWL